MGRRYARMKSGELFDFQTRSFVSARDSRSIPSDQIDGDGSLIDGVVLGLKIIGMVLGVVAAMFVLYWATTTGHRIDARAAQTVQEALPSYGSAHLDEGARLRALAR